MGALGMLMWLSAALGATEEGQAMPDTLRVSAVQMEVTGDLDKNAARIECGIEEAAKAGARVAVFPETALSGFDAKTVAALDWTRLEAAMARVSDAARRNGIYVLYGTATKSGKPRPYNSAILIGPDGAEVTRYHKMVPESHFEPGDRLALFEIDGVPATVIVCHDERLPELVRIPVLGGARICFYISYEINSMPSALRKMEGYRAQLIARAVENGIWVVQANGVGPLDSEGSASLGFSRIVGPDGIVVAEAPGLVEHTLVYDIKPEAATRKNATESLGMPLLSDFWKEGLSALQHKPREAAPLPPASSPPSTTVRLALMKAVPEKWNLDANFDVFLHLLDEASAAGAQVFVTPECWLDGYAAPAPTSTPDRLRGIAQDVASSPYLKRVAEEARKRSLFICFGYTSLEDGKIYNAAGLWGADGALVGIYHKTHLQTHDLQFSPGMDLPVWPTPWGPVGIMICADRRWPETARTLRLKGAKLILNPTYGMHHETNEWWMRTRGYENQCFIAFAHPQVSFVVDPKGDIAAKRDDPDPGVLICDADLTRAKDDNHIRDRRPDLYGIIAQPK